MSPPDRKPKFKLRHYRAEHLTAAESALNNALTAEDAGSAKMAVESAEIHLKASKQTSANNPKN